MNGETDRLLERIRQRRRAIEAELGAARRPPAGSRFAPGDEHPIGARVFDPHTGQEGEVIGAGAENIVVPTPKR